MDALALLCNLYGNGPATLRRLRDAGCSSFHSLERIAPEDLAEILDTSVAAAKTFLGEARALIERVQGGDSGEVEGAVPGTGAAERPATEPAPAVGTGRRAPQPAARPGTALEAAGIAGIDPRSRERLRSLGVVTLEELAGADVLDLSRAGRLGLTRLMRLQFLARRHLERASGPEPGLRAATLSAAPPERAGERFSPRGLPIPSIRTGLEAELAAAAQRQVCPAVSDTV